MYAKMNKEHQKFKRLDVEQLNIVEADGTVKMSLFNSEHMPPLIFEGEDILPGHRQDDELSGIMFYNGKGFECGGLIFGSKEQANGEHESVLSLTFDQYLQDQVVQMFNVERNGKQTYGFNFFDRPKETIKETIEKMNQIDEIENKAERDRLMQEIDDENPRRMFIGKTTEGDITMQMHDRAGRERIRISIDQEDQPKIEMFNSVGEVLYKLPPEESE